MLLEMNGDNRRDMPSRAHDIETPSPWVARWAGTIRAGGRVLDVACGQGRHIRYLASRGFAVVGVDRDEQAMSAVRASPGVELRAADIEGGPWPFPPADFDGVVVTNYFHRPLFPHLVAALRAGGILIYETFARGNERYGRPSNPDFLLEPGELLRRIEPLSVVAFEQGLIESPKQALVQRICAVRGDSGASGSQAIALK
jgi:SAM-dependent methyltransferase